MTDKTSQGTGGLKDAAAAKLDLYGDYDENGVDVSLLRYMLSLAPLDRLKVMEQHARDTEILHEYGRRHRESKTRQNR